MAKQPGHNARGITISGLASKMLTLYGNRLLLLSALDSKGAIGRSLRIPFVRLVARFLGWWSRGWVGQALGLGWAVTMFGEGFRDKLDPAATGDDWKLYRSGHIPGAKR